MGHDGWVKLLLEWVVVGTDSNELPKLQNIKQLIFKTGYKIFFKSKVFLETL